MSRILIIDDEETIRELLSRRLSGRGYEVETAVNAESAEMLMLHEKFDLVITDVRMGVISGTDFIRSLRRVHRSRVPVIVMTGFPQQKAFDAAREYGVIRFFAKPFSFDDLYAAVVEAIGEPAVN